MRRIAPGLLILLLLAAGPGRAQPAAASCRPGPLPPALESVPPLPDAAAGSVGFSAAPSLEYPGRAWVVRAWSSRGAATLEILRLRREDDCNVYGIENRWRAPLPAGDYRALLRSAERLAIPRRDYFSNDAPGRDPIMVFADGTGIELRMERMGWEARRALHHSEPGGASLSAVFHALVSKHVPADLRPSKAWRAAAR